MGGRTFRVAGGLLAGALALIVLAGPATMAFADGGPDRVAGPAQPRPGFGDRIPPPRPGFGDRIKPAGAPHRQPAAAPVVRAAAAGESTGGWSTAATVTVAALAVGASMALALAVRRRHRVATA